jgi:hypothetical protein
LLSAFRALGGWLANGARLLTIACAILLTIFKDRFWPPFQHDDEATGRGAGSSKDAGMTFRPHWNPIQSAHAGATPLAPP